MSRGVFIAALAAPIVVAACVVLAVEVAEVGDRAWWEDTRPANAAEAAAFNRPAALVRQLRQGDHPEQIVAVRAEMIREAPAWLSPVEGAIWSDGPAMIRLMEREGAVLTDARRRQLACLARDLGQEASAEYLAPDNRAACVPGAALAAVRSRTGPS